jgi:hypothetical protein
MNQRAAIVKLSNRKGWAFVVVRRASGNPATGPGSAHLVQARKQGFSAHRMASNPVIKPQQTPIASHGSPWHNDRAISRAT